MYLLQFPILRRVQYKNVGGHFFGQEYVQTVSRLRFSPFTGRFFLRAHKSKGVNRRQKKKKGREKQKREKRGKREEKARKDKKKEKEERKRQNKKRRKKERKREEKKGKKEENRCGQKPPQKKDRFFAVFVLPQHMIDSFLINKSF